MKTKFLENWKVVLVLAALPLVAASLQTPVSNALASENGDDDVLSVPADPLTAAVDTNQSAITVTNLSNAITGTNVTVETNLEIVAKPSQPTLPDMKLTGGATEMIKLAQAGVAEDVMLSYITNSTTRFSLGPDEIIYLNDLGLSSALVTAMIQHDAALDGTTAAYIAAAMPVTQPETVIEPVPTTMPETTPDYVDNGNYIPVDYSTPQDTSYFYDSLAPYGSWVAVAGYGLCWQPTVYVRNPAWRPYCDRGRWLYSDCGWYWQSDYSWGWAAFHYGRWYCDANRGWVWCPNRVWGPAWVSWRQSGDYCGWAPLPPAARFDLVGGFSYHNRAVTPGFGFGLGAGLYTFIPISRMSDYAPNRYGVTGAQATRVFNQAAVVNNVRVQNNRVFNPGVNPATVETAARVPVRRAVIEETSIRAGNGVLADQIEKRGDTLTVLRPSLPDTGRGANGRRGGSADTATAQRGRAESPRGTTTPVVPPPVTTAKPALPPGRATSSSTTPGMSDTRPRVEVYHRPDAPAATPPSKPILVPNTPAAADSGAKISTSSATPGVNERRPRVETYVRPDAAPATTPVLVPNKPAGGTITGLDARPETTPPNSIILMGPGSGRANNANAAPRSTAQEIYRADTSFTVKVPRSSIEPPAQTYTPPVTANGNGYGRSSVAGQSAYRSTSDYSSAAPANNSPAFEQGQGRNGNANGNGYANGNAYGNGMNRNFGNSSPAQVPILVPSRPSGGGQSAPVYSAPAYNPPAARSAPVQAPILVPQQRYSPPPSAPAPAPAPAPSQSQSQSSSRSGGGSPSSSSSSSSPSSSSSQGQSRGR